MLSEPEALARLQRAKTAYRSHVKINYEFRARDCHTCQTPGACCTDAHFVNVHITRLEAAAIRDTLTRTPRLSDEQRRTVYKRAAQTIARYNLRESLKSRASLGTAERQTYSCPLFEPQVGCLVHARAKPAPCIQHACYERWEDVPPVKLQWRTEHQIEELNNKTYGNAWAWLPTPLWLHLIDPDGDGRELAQLLQQWSTQPQQRQLPDATGLVRHHHSANLHSRSLPILK